MVQRFHDTGTVNDLPRSGRPSVLTATVVSDVQQRMALSPRKSLCRLSQETSVSRGSVQRCVKKLGLHPYRITVVQELCPPDTNKRLHFCRWFRRFIARNPGVLDITFFTDEAWFHLSGHINSQNSRMWASNNPNVLHQEPLHSAKIGVWCAISRRRIIGPLFFTDTINTERYLNIIQQFICLLVSNERYCWFQQDGATAHTSHTTMNALEEFFGNRIISKNLWPPRSPDLSPADFYLWGYLKERVYSNNPQTLEALQHNIENVINTITPATLKRVSASLRTRVSVCMLENGGHFQHLL